MDFLDIPKILEWEQQLTQLYTTPFDILITGGCSFTASTTQIDAAASWPGFVKDRCGFKTCIDMSYPGFGNFQIKNSIFQALEQIDYVNPLVIIMWSGLDRYPNFGTPQDSIQAIKETKKRLQQCNIQYAFTTYLNMFYPPFAPVRDATPKYIDYDINAGDFFPNKGQHFLYEWALKRDQLNDDLYHPTVEANLSWTDQILLTHLHKQNIIQALGNNFN